MRRISMRLWPCLLALVACSGEGDDGRALRFAATQLGVAASELRVTSQSDLTGARHGFYLISTASGPALVVVVPKQGPLFDSRTPDAFSRVSRAEDAARRIGQLGAERVASWFAALGGGVCPPTPADQPHFATAVRQQDGGVRVTYSAPGAQGLSRSCSIELAPDGALRQARVTEEPRAQGSRWSSDAN
jgi:hypothetical protein